MFLQSRCCADGITEENLLTRAKFTSCSALRWLCITQHFEIGVAKFDYLGIVEVYYSKTN